MPSSDTHRHRTRPSFMLALKKSTHKSFPDQDVKNESRHSHILPASSNSSGLVHSPSSNSSKSTRKGGRLSQAPGDVIVLAGQDAPSSKQPHTLVQTTSATPEHASRRLVRVPSSSRPSKVIYTQHYPPRQVAPSHANLSRPTVSDSGHSEHSSAQLKSECSDQVRNESRPKHSGRSLEDAVADRVRPSTDHGRHLSHSLPTPSNSQRRLSLDLLPPSPLSPIPSSNGYSISLSHPTWAKEPNTPLDEVSEGLFGSASPRLLSEKQRALNVKRAKKMAQVFGSEPPQALFQVSRLAQEGGVVGLGTDRFGGSVTTLLLPSSNNLLSPALPPEPRPATTSNTASAYSTTTIPKPESESEPLSPLAPSYITPPAIPSRSKSVVEPILSKSEEEFRRRRLRAAKLAKFFGVRYHDLQQHVPGKIPTHSHNTTVEVAVAQKGAFWERPQHHHSHHYEADMQDVLQQLREMKAST